MICTVPALLVISVITVQAILQWPLRQDSLTTNYSMAPEKFGKDCDGGLGNQRVGGARMSVAIAHVQCASSQVTRD